MKNIYTYITLPIGKLLLLSDGQALTGLYFTHAKHLPNLDSNKYEAQEVSIFCDTYAQLNEYISGNRKEFNINYRLQGTDFQKKVWALLSTIPCGHVTSYQNIANLIGRPSAVRAVANAVSRNPISIIVPCHRVIGMDGSLTGYAGGLDLKKTLLSLEHEFEYTVE